MAKEEMLEFEGVVDEVLPDARCRVKLDNGHVVIAYTSGRMKKNRIRILAGDKSHRGDDAVRPRQGPHQLPPQGHARARPPAAASAARRSAAFAEAEAVGSGQ